MDLSGSHILYATHCTVISSKMKDNINTYYMDLSESQTVCTRLPTVRSRAASGQSAIGVNVQYLQYIPNHVLSNLGLCV